MDASTKLEWVRRSLTLPGFGGFWLGLRRAAYYGYYVPAIVIMATFENFVGKLCRPLCRKVQPFSKQLDKVPRQSGRRRQANGHNENCWGDCKRPAETELAENYRMGRDLQLKLVHGLRSDHRAGDACPAQNTIKDVVRVRQ